MRRDLHHGWASHPYGDAVSASGGGTGLDTIWRGPGDTKPPGYLLFSEPNTRGEQIRFEVGATSSSSRLLVNRQ